MLTTLSLTGCRYWNMNAARVPARASESRAGSSRTSPAVLPSAGSAQADRSGAVTIRNAPRNSPRWLGLRRAAMARSVPEGGGQAARRRRGPRPPPRPAVPHRPADPARRGGEARVEHRMPGGEEALQQRAGVVGPAVEEQPAQQPGGQDGGDQVGP